MIETARNPHTLAQRLHDVETQIRQAEEKAARPKGSVTLIAVSKFHPASCVDEAYAAGQRTFGENRVQEAITKFNPLKTQHPQIKLHLIGGLQRNKAQHACRIADVIESLDRPSLAHTLQDIGEKEGKLPQLFIEVNTGDEPQKFGIAREEAPSFIKNCQQRFGSYLKGLMCIPPTGEDPRQHFRYLRNLAHDHGLSELSMGMSADFPQAIEEGATYVRVGTAIFGPRPVTQK